MGASHTTLSSTSIGIEDGIPELEGNQSELSAYALDQHLFPGSGRMMRTFRLRHKSNASTVVLKSTLVAKDQESLVEQQQQELKRIRSALKGQTHVAPFFHWTLGSYRPKANIIVRQIYIMRPHMFTTLSDRLASRPFLTHVEKLWIAYQILQALHAMHEKGVVHGFLTAENVGLSSWNWVVLLDLASYKARTALPDDDPTEYLYYFQENYQSGTDTTPREKRCYLAPERFYTPSLDPSTEVTKSPLTPAMDIFSAGCVIMETFLNGERALDLGDLMEYRKKKSSQTLLQKLNKIEFSALRAACRHMLHLDPAERLSASAYIERLEASGLLPESFSTLATMMERATYATPDARLAIAATYFSRVIWETLGIRDAAGSQFVQNVLGPTMAKLEKLPSGSTASLQSGAEEKKEEPMSSADLFAETEALLKRLEEMNLESEADAAMALDTISTPNATSSLEESKVERSEMAQHSLLVYLQLVLSTVRNVQRPSSKLVALQLMERVGRYSDDEARLQRILPVAVSLLQDHDPLVRAKAIQVLVSTVSPIESFPPSDSKVFPEYIFKRVSHLITDPCLVVRLSFARSIAVLAETAQRFLDISHAVRLYEAVGGVTSGNSQDGHKETKPSIKDVFTDDVAKLLDESSNSKETKADSVADSAGSEGAPTAGKALFKSTYSSELGVLQETVSRWVVHITTDQSEKSSPVKQALLEDMARLCTFFGLDGVLAFILPQVLSFLNERKDWQLRASLFDCLPSVCHIVGRAATEHFVIPCLETALADEEEAVISRALRCLTKLLSMNLLSRALMLGTPSSGAEGDSSQGLLAKYAVLLVHPSADVRYFAIETVILLSRSLGHPDAVVFVSPVLKPFLRFQPSLDNLTNRQGFELCLQKPWERARFQSELEKMSASSDYAMSPTSGNWTSIAFEPHNKPDQAEGDRSSVAPLAQVPKSRNDLDVQVSLMRDYLKLLARRKAFLPKGDAEKCSLRSQLNQCIEAPIKQSQQIKFPKQSIPGLPASTLPNWYRVVRNAREEQNCSGAETVAIRTVASLGQVYGLSIMDQNGGGSAPTHADVSSEEAVNLLLSDESQRIKAASAGEWGSETFLNPTLTDTSLLVTKLNALQVPPLPPKLSDDSISMSRNNNNTQNARGAQTKEQTASSPESKLKIDTMVATSKCSPEHGHSAPIVRLVVSHDQRFFVTGSHDGTCRVWELDKAEKSNGILESSLVYSAHGHSSGGYPKVKDVAVVEGGHSVVSGTSDGSVHVWRVDMVSSSKTPATQADNRDVSRVVGSSEIRRLEPNEGEILAINHFNTNSSSILTYASQRGYIHSWDLRAAQEPFQLKTPQDTGYITSMAVGSDRNWVVTGTSKGFISLWDLRFQQILKLWHHSRSAPVNRLATSFVPPPQSWSSTRGNVDSLARPFLFAASGPNECAMFDLWSGTCRECFRTIDYGGRYAGKVNIEGLPTLEEMPLSGPSRRKAILSKDIGPNLGHTVASSFRSVNAMVGSIGASDHSFLITGGSDCRIRFWDFALPSKCYVSMGPESMQPRPTFERIDNDQTARLMLCRQPPIPSNKDLSSSKLPRKLLQGTKRAENVHEDAITDLKVVKAGLLSSSRDCTVKLWR